MKSIDRNPSHVWPELAEQALADLRGADGGAQAADGSGVCLRLLVDLEKQRGLFEGLQSFLGAAVGQLPVNQPVLQLPAAVPEAGQSGTVSVTQGDPGPSCGVKGQT